jgi:flagellar hook-associated protein 1 FlgK
MSLSSALSSATNGLQVTQSSLKLVSDNVARANDASYTRKTLHQTTDVTGNVVIARESRQTDAVVQAQLNTSTAQSSGDATRDSVMQQIGTLLGTSDGSLPLKGLSEGFASAWRQLEATPTDEVAQREVINQGDSLAREVRRLGDGIEVLDRQIQNQTATAVEDVNSLLNQINDANNTIVAQKSSGATTTNAEDARDQLISKLNDLIGVRTVERSDGRLAVFTSSGLSMVDVLPIKLAYDGDTVTLAGLANPVTTDVNTGKIGALLGLRTDGSKSTPPQIVDNRPDHEVIRKLRSQLDGFVASLTGPAAAGQPATLNEVYAAATPTQSGQFDGAFFDGSGRSDISVNQDLLNGTLTLKTSAITATSATINAAGRAFSADGLQLSDVSVTDIANGIFTTFSKASSAVSTQAKASGDTKSLLDTRYHGVTGVNLDEEVANLQVLQTSYGASAQVLRTINALFQTLEQAIQ